MDRVGIDIGGSGIKAAAVDTTTGQLVTERLRIRTPQPATPDTVAAAVRDLATRLHATGPVGVAIPAVVTGGVARTAANIDRSWVDTDVTRLLADATGHSVTVLNDADAAGVAETRFGAARGHVGVVLVLTLGTGIGSALVSRGHLVPNTELGHLEVLGREAETWASDAARQREDLSWPQWAERLTRYLRHVEDLFWPELIVLGGGASKRGDSYLPLLHTRTPVVPAQLRNTAGIVGAALAAAG